MHVIWVVLCACETELHAGLRTTQNTVSAVFTCGGGALCVCCVCAALRVPRDAHKPSASSVKAVCTLAGLHPV